MCDCVYHFLCQTLRDVLSVWNKIQNRHVLYPHRTTDQEGNVRMTFLFVGFCRGMKIGSRLASKSLCCVIHLDQFLEEEREIKKERGNLRRSRIKVEHSDTNENSFSSFRTLCICLSVYLSLFWCLCFILRLLLLCRLLTTNINTETWEELRFSSTNINFCTCSCNKGADRFFNFNSNLNKEIDNVFYKIFSCMQRR